jgi:hypothetical protein
MEYKLGYIYQTETQAIAARQKAADYMGLPMHPNDTTIYWVDYNYSQLDQFWYISHVDGLELVFGQPTEFQISFKK